MLTASRQPARQSECPIRATAAARIGPPEYGLVVRHHAGTRYSPYRHRSRCRARSGASISHYQACGKTSAGQRAMSCGERSDGDDPADEVSGKRPAGAAGRTPDRPPAVAGHGNSPDAGSGAGCGCTQRGVGSEPGAGAACAGASGHAPAARTVGLETAAGRLAVQPPGQRAAGPSWPSAAGPAGQLAAAATSQLAATTMGRLATSSATAAPAAVRSRSGRLSQPAARLPDASAPVPEPAATLAARRARLTGPADRGMEAPATGRGSQRGEGGAAAGMLAE